MYLNTLKKHWLRQDVPYSADWQRSQSFVSFDIWPSVIDVIQGFVGSATSVDDE